MKLKLLFAFFLVHFQYAFCQWTDLNTGINDNLSGVVFFGTKGLISGTNGLYYTSTGGSGAASWTRFQITNNTAISDIYENTTFTHCYSDPYSSTTNYVFACGQNRVTLSAVLMRINLNTMSYDLLYQGAANTKLNKIGFSKDQGRYFAVGDNGLVVRFSNTLLQAPVEAYVGNDDFSSISFKDNICMISANGKILYTADFDNTYTFTTVLTPNSNNKDIDLDNNISYAFSVGNKFAANYNTSARVEYDFYDYGPLNANAVLYSNSCAFVATDHGIFRNGGTTNKVLEWQPSSLNNAIDEIWALSTGTTIYACGPNGRLLKTTNAGGSNQPFVRIYTIGGCVNQGFNIVATTGTTSACSWYVDNQLVQSTCGNLARNFPIAGDYEIKLTVQNTAGLQSTHTKIIHITSQPIANKPVTVSDNILCHSETIEIQIENSEPNVAYTLKKDMGLTTYGTSGVGNGGTITFTTSQINTSGNYFLEAKNVMGSCSVYFSDIIPITVEQTKAEFHADLINAKTDEVINLYGKTAEAQNFQWDFTSNAPLITSNLEHPSVALPVAGPATINLDAWSNNGCHDEIEKGVFVYEEPVNPDQCWTMVNVAPDSEWNGHFYDGICDLKPTPDGFLACGGYKNAVFDSEIGITRSLLGKSGSYLQKYDKNGALKWVVYTEHVSSTGENDQMFSIVTDQLGNIYICGFNNGYITDNKGDKYDLSPMIGVGSNSNNGYIVKLDPMGKVVWTLTSHTTDFIPSNVFIDKENNLVAVGFLSTNSTGTFPMYLNGQPSFTISQAIEGVTSNDNFTMLKISPSGSLIWNVGGYFNLSNGRQKMDIGFDSTNNIYLTGSYEYSSKFYSVGNPAPQILAAYPGNIGSRMFLAKYNTSGILQWKTRSHVQTPTGTDDVFVSSMVTDDDGNCYITGRNRCGLPTKSHVFENTNGTTTSNSVGGLFVMRVDANGICQWIRGNKNTVYGIGNEIIKVGNELHVVGEIEASGPPSTSTFDSTDNQNYTLSMNGYDVLMVTYDINGNLSQIMTSGDNSSLSYVPKKTITGFFKGDGGAFYLGRDLHAVVPNTYNFFGETINTDGVDATITKFNVGCGILKYQRQLDVNEYELQPGITLFPNPTSGDFVIDLKESQPEVVVEIFDVLGKKIFSQSLSDVKEINTSIQADKGLYFVKVKTKDKVSSFKMIKN